MEPVPVSGRRSRRYKIAWVLMGVLLIVGILPVTMLSSRLIILNKEALKTQQQVNQLQMASSLAHHIDSYVDAKERIVSVLADALSLQAEGLPPDKFRTSLSSRRTLSKYVDENVTLLRYTHLDGDWVTAMQEGFEVEPGMELLLNEGFAVEMNTGKTGLVRVAEPFFLERLNGPVVLMTAPVLREERRIGVISALVSLARLWRNAERSSGYSHFALTGEGELFTHQEAEFLMPVAFDPDLEIVKEFIATGGNRVMPYTVASKGGRFTDLLGSYYETRRGWGVFIQAEEDLAYSFVERMKSDTWFYALIAAVGSVILGFLFAGWISRPIKSLADSSRAFAEGDFSARVPIRSGNEVGELAETFNVLAETLERYIARLKKAAVENSELFLGSVRALAAAIDEKDTYTRGHSERVRDYAASLARAMKLPPLEIWKIELGALLHDVGKIGIEDRILNKPGPLTSDEYEVMKTHPVRGANIMAPIRQMREVIPAMKYHHERWDGGGYPEGLAGENIPMAARVVTIADCFDAMTTNRPYQRAMTMEEAIDRLKKLEKKVFDAGAVAVFVEALRRGDCGETYRQAQQQVQDTAESVDRIQAQQLAVAGRRPADPDCLPPMDDEDPPRP